VTVFRWSLDRGAPAVPPSITIALGTNFHVSSIERDARTGHYVLVAGPQRLLAEISQRRAVVVHRLEQRLHAQPEGVTFVGDSLLVVADEGSTGPATLTCYRRTR
jgi:hypothetical protein